MTNDPSTTESAQPTSVAAAIPGHDAPVEGASRHGDDLQIWKKVPLGLELWGLVVGGLGFAVSTQSSSTSWANGEVISFSYSDPAALIAGGLCLLLGVASLASLGRTQPSRKLIRVGLAVGLLGLGGLHLARGVGAFATPAAPGSSSFQRPGEFAGAAALERAPATYDAADIKERFDRFGEQCLAGTSCEEFAEVAALACKHEARLCSGLGLLIHYMGGAGAADVEAARAAFQRACNEGSERNACAALNLLFEDATLNTEEGIKARPMIEKACTKRNMVACALLATMLQDGLGGEVDLAQARALAESSCQAGVGRGCLLIGLSLYDSERDSKQARAAFDRGCERASEGSCWKLAGMLQRGEGGPTDAAAAKSMAQRACELGEPNACDALGMISPWIGHPSHADAETIRFDRHREGRDDRQIRAGDRSASAGLAVAKGSRSLDIRVYSKEDKMELGSFARLAAVEAFIDAGQFYVLVYEHTTEGKITSTKGFRFAVGGDKLTASGRLQSRGRPDWRTSEWK